MHEFELVFPQFELRRPTIPWFKNAALFLGYLRA
jgi:hypothetical protein